MKIDRIETFILAIPLDEPFAFSQGWVARRVATLVRVTASDGTVGWGEAFAQGLEAPQIAAAAIDHALAPLLLGENPLDTHRLWHRMVNTCRDFGRTGSVMAAISAIDIALWDVAGKHFGVPVYQLLGGAHRRQVQPYATGFYRLSGQGEASRLAEEARGHLADGFTAMKVKLGFGIDDDRRVMAAIRDALDGADVELMVDTNHAYGRSDALRLGRALEPYALRWYEEPVIPEDLDGYRALRDRLDVPIAGGENCHSPYGFHALFRAGAVDIAQPDVASCGGITALRDIAAMAQAAGIAVNPHVWGSAVAQAASLQVIAALPTAHPSLFARDPLLEYDRSEHPFRQHLIEAPWRMVGNRVPVPDGPGLGIDVRLEVVERFRIA